MIAEKWGGISDGIPPFSVPEHPTSRQVTNSGGRQGAEPPGYLEPYANVVTTAQNEAVCPGFYIATECQNGHRFAKKLVCGKEFCPTCGAEWSDAHKRRFSRWLPKAEQMTTMGYFVFTLPLEARDRYRTKEALNELTKEITGGDKSRKIVGILKDEGFGRGLVRWHWFGGRGNIFHPHLNVLVEAGKISKDQLQRIKARYAQVLGVPVAVVNYSYVRSQKRMVHRLKYITRATFIDRRWDPKMAEELFNFRNQRTWGEWKGPQAWELVGEAKYQHIEDLESGICPVCREPLGKWSRAIPVCLLEMERPTDIGAGYYRLPDTS